MEKKTSKVKDLYGEEVVEEIPIEFDFDDEMIKHVVILNPSKEKAALERYFNSFPQIIGRENHKFRNNE